eukprot:3995906-Prymnesium_polylepis.1
MEDARRQAKWHSDTKLPQVMQPLAERRLISLRRVVVVAQTAEARDQSAHDLLGPCAADREFEVRG